MGDLSFHCLRWAAISGVIASLITASGTEAPPIVDCTDAHYHESFACEAAESFAKATREAPAPACPANSKAWAAFESRENFTVERIPGAGYGFYFFNPNLSRLAGGPNVTRGIIFIPADGVSPVSYAPYARSVALEGYYVLIARKATLGSVLEAMIQHSELEHWTIAGHGTGGMLAARIAIAVQPRVKALILIASPLPPELDLRSINLYVIVLYGAADTINTSSGIEESFSRLRGDTFVERFPALGHYDFAYSTCVGDTASPVGGNSAALTPSITDALLSDIILSLSFQAWFQASRRGLSFGDNHFLTPGFNDSKPYPGHIRVRFDQIQVDGTSPQRLWWIFTPTEIKGGIVYFSGAGVDGKAYFPLAFQIAARGHLVVIPEVVGRYAHLSLVDATAIIDSKLEILSGVPEGRWAIAGHSLGGGAASRYYGCYGNKIYGAVMHSGQWEHNVNTSDVPVLQLYGDLDDIKNGVENFKNYYLGLFNPDKTTFRAVVGANHYQVGDYGFQYPDEIATMDRGTQQAVYADITVSFLDSLENNTTYAPALSGVTCMNGFL